MQVIITKQESKELFFYVSAECGKTSAEVVICKHNGRINVCCNNAAHKVWKGMGKWFASVEEAMQNYRSPQMRLIIGQASLAFLAQ